MMSDRMFDPPETQEIDVDEANPKKDVCDLHNKPAVIKVKRSYIKHASYIYLCDECEIRFSENWEDLFDDR